MAPCKSQVNAKRNLICSSCDSWIYFAKSGCAHSWVEVQSDDFHFVCRGCKTVKCLQDQVNELRQMILMMTGEVEKEESRGGKMMIAEVARPRRAEVVRTRKVEVVKTRRTEVVRTRRAVAMRRRKLVRRRKVEKGRMCNKRKISE